MLRCFSLGHPCLGKGMWSTWVLAISNISIFVRLLSVNGRTFTFDKLARRSSLRFTRLPILSGKTEK